MQLINRGNWFAKWHRDRVVDALLSLQFSSPFLSWALQLGRTDARTAASSGDESRRGVPVAKLAKRSELRQTGLRILSQHRIDRRAT